MKTTANIPPKAKAEPAPGATKRPEKPLPLGLAFHYLKVKFALLEYAFQGAVDLWEHQDEAGPFHSLLEDMGHDLHNLEVAIRAITSTRAPAKAA